MKLLFISPYAPVRIRTRPHHFLSALAGRGHDLTLATLYEDSAEKGYLTELEGAGVRVIARPAGRVRSLAGAASAVAVGLPMQARFSWDRALADDIAAAHAEAPFQAIHIEHLRGAAYGTDLRRRAGLRVPVIWDSVDSISHLFSQAARHSISPFGRIAGRLELGSTRRYEAAMVRGFDRVLVTSEQDRRALAELAGPGSEARIRVIPNGVDMGLFTPIDGPRLRDTIVFSGKMSYHANITAAVRFVRDVMPLIWDRKPETRLQIVGKDPDRQVRKLGEADGRIRVVGAVAEMQPYLASAAVAVAPIAYGAGIQNKVLEAMACCTPVVATPQAAAALEAVPGRDLLVADGPPAFAGEVLRLLEDDSLRMEIGACGYRYVHANHRWEDAAVKLEDVYHEAIQAVR